MSRMRMGPMYPRVTLTAMCELLDSGVAEGTVLLGRQRQRGKEREREREVGEREGGREGGREDQDKGRRGQRKKSTNDSLMTYSLWQPHLLVELEEEESAMTAASCFEALQKMCLPVQLPE